MAIFVRSVADRPAANQETSMIKTPKKPTVKNHQKAAPRLIAVIKNGHTDAELDEMEERWVNYQGPRMTLAEVMAVEKAKAELKTKAAAVD
jgi:hypothetical protein